MLIGKLVLMLSPVFTIRLPPLTRFEAVLGLLTMLFSDPLGWGVLSCDANGSLNFLTGIIPRHVYGQPHLDIFLLEI